MRIIKRLVKKINWMQLLFMGAFTFSALLCFKADYEITKNIFMVIGIIASYISVSLIAEDAKKEYEKDKLDASRGVSEC